MTLTRERVIDAGMESLAADGLSGLSMRGIAERLGVHAGSLYYHVPNKDALLALMADRVAQQAYDAGTEALAALPADAGCSDRLRAQARALRRVIGSHFGGAILLAASPKALSAGALALMARLLETLAAGGVAPDRQVAIADTLISYVTGFVLQEQAEQMYAGQSVLDPAVADDFPTVIAAAGRFSDDEMFERGLDVISNAGG